MTNHHRSISALENGTVIDHINSENTLKVVNILKLNQEQEKMIMIGVNFKSKTMMKKGLIKIANKELSMEELNKIAIVAPNASIAIVKNYEIIKKSKLDFPKEFVGIAKCGNTNCITNHEPVKTHFKTISEEPVMVKCKYCEKVFGNDIEIIQIRDKVSLGGDYYFIKELQNTSKRKTAKKRYSNI